jgi:hypothetical protein
MNTPRKIVQIAAIPETNCFFCTVFALANDGTTWSHSLERKGTAWVQLNLGALPERGE